MRYGCIGRKLTHSFSREIHAELFDYEYELRELEPEEIGAFLTAREFQAINVTIPYKQTVMPYLDEISDTARRIGAVNTIVCREGKLHGYNTDYTGMRAMLARAGISLRGKKVLIAGSGGTSKTAAAVAADLGAAEIFRLSRDGKDGCITYETARREHADAEALINTTPLGMYPSLGGKAVDLDDFPRLAGVADAVYNPLCPALVVEALSRGIRACGGLYMLVAQAAAAAEKFTGETVEEKTVDKVYRKLFRRKQNIVLVGMPGSGKSTVGRLIARKLDRPFIDTDEMIAERYGDIPALFEKEGESAFRDKESGVIREIAAAQGAVIATGGGAVLRPENIENLRQNGVIYYIDRPLSDILPTEDRPLSRDRAALEKRYAERRPLYLAAGRRIAAGDGAAFVADKIVKEFLK